MLSKKICQRCQHFSQFLGEEQQDSWECNAFIYSFKMCRKANSAPDWCPYQLEHLMENQVQ